MLNGKSMKLSDAVYSLRDCKLARNPFEAGTTGKTYEGRRAAKKVATGRLMDLAEGES